MENKIDSAYADIGEFFGKIYVGHIVIPDGNKNYKYNPKEDITTYEVSRLILLFYFAGTVKDHFTVDYYSYIQEQRLERHFDEV